MSGQLAFFIAAYVIVLNAGRSNRDRPHADGINLPDLSSVDVTDADSELQCDSGLLSVWAGNKALLFERFELWTLGAFIHGSRNRGLTSSTQMTWRSCWHIRPTAWSAKYSARMCHIGFSGSVRFSFAVSLSFSSRFTRQSSALAKRSRPKRRARHEKVSSEVSSGTSKGMRACIFWK